MSANTTQSPAWWVFEAYNTPSVYAYGTESEADRYAKHLNDSRDINLYEALVADIEGSDLLDQLDGIDLAEELEEIDAAARSRG